MQLALDAASIARQVFRAERLGGKGRVLSGRSQCQMHLGCAPAEHGRGVKRGACMLLYRPRMFRRAGEIRVWRGRGGRQRSDRVEILLKLIEEPSPAVALVGDKPLQHSDGSLFASLRRDADLAQEGRDAGELRRLRQEAANLDIRVFTRLQAAEELEDELVSVKNRCVRLLSRAHARDRTL